MTGRAALAALAVLAGHPVDSEARQSGDQPAGVPVLPDVVRALEGAWVGEGTLMGRPGGFSMRWRPDGDGSVHLAFANGFTEGGTLVPVLTATATYRFSGDSASGVWMDDRPQRLTLQAVVTDSSIVTRWVAEAEEGRTEYVVRSSESVSVRDFVLVEGEYQLFAEAVYRREPGSGSNL